MTMSIKFYKIIGFITIFIVSPCIVLAGESNTISIKAVEKAALDKAPELDEISSQKSAFEDASIAAGQLKDPKLQLGLLNIPTNSFKLDQENMTQFKIGISQDFPRGKSLEFASQAKKFMAETQRFQLDNKKAEIVRNVRLYWIELYYLLTAKKILEQNKKVFLHLVEVTTSRLSTGSGYQHDVLKAQIDLTKIENLILKNQEDIDQIRVSLGRFVGEELAMKSNPEMLPIWPKLKEQQQLIDELKQHPLLKKSQSTSQVANAQLKETKESYKPAWSAGIYYSVRQGRAPMSHQKRSDFIGIQISTELPFFTANRQDRRVSESSKLYQASKSQYMVDFLDLKKQVSNYYAEYKSLDSQEQLYKRKYLEEAKQYAESTKSAYENSQIEFDIVSRAYVQMLNVSLQHIMVQTQKAQIRAQILYLESHS